MSVLPLVFMLILAAFAASHNASDPIPFNFWPKLEHSGLLGSSWSVRSHPSSVLALLIWLLGPLFPGTLHALVAADSASLPSIEQADANAIVMRLQYKVSDESALIYLASIGLEIHDAKTFFDMLAGVASDKYIDIETFVKGAFDL